MAEEPRKRSRFDQTDSEPPRRSRFDRRSRSPSNRDSEARRSRSPIRNSGSPAVTEIKDPAAAAAAAAAKINAQIQARKGVQHVDVPPIRSVQMPPLPSFPENTKPARPALADLLSSKTDSPSGAQSPDANGLNKEIYTQDGDYIRDVEVNDLRNRYTLTKGSTQKMVITHCCVPLMLPGFHYSLTFSVASLQTTVKWKDSSLLAQQPQSIPV